MELTIIKHTSLTQRKKGLRFLKGLKILQHTHIRTNENHTHGHKPKSIKSDREREERAYRDNIW